MPSASPPSGSGCPSTSLDDCRALGPPYLNATERDWLFLCIDYARELYCRTIELANGLRVQGAIDESRNSIDAAFASAKGSGEEIGPTKRGKGVKIMAIGDRHGLPLAVTAHAAR